MAGLTAGVAHRRFLQDVLDDAVLPSALRHHPEVAALEIERQRLVKAFRDAEASGSGGGTSQQDYIAERARALREGRDLPPAPPTAAELAAGAEERQRNIAAAEAALLAHADLICEVMRAHPEWEDEVRAAMKAARDEAEEARRRADQAEQRAVETGFLAQWLERTAADELYVMTSNTDPANWSAIDAGDDSLLAMVDAIRESRPI